MLITDPCWLNGEQYQGRWTPLLDSKNMMVSLIIISDNAPSLLQQGLAHDVSC